MLATSQFLPPASTSVLRKLFSFFAWQISSQSTSVLRKPFSFFCLANFFAIHIYSQKTIFFFCLENFFAIRICSQKTIFFFCLANFFAIHIYCKILKKLARLQISFKSTSVLKNIYYFLLGFKFLCNHIYSQNSVLNLT